MQNKHTHKTSIPHHQKWPQHTVNIYFCSVYFYSRPSLKLSKQKISTAAIIPMKEYIFLPQRNLQKYSSDLPNELITAAKEWLHMSFQLDSPLDDCIPDDNEHLHVFLLCHDKFKTWVHFLHQPQLLPQSSAETLTQGFGWLFVLYIINKYVQSTSFITQRQVTNGREAYFHSGICSLQKYGTAEENVLRWRTILCRILENATELPLPIFFIYMK